MYINGYFTLKNSIGSFIKTNRSLLCSEYNKANIIVNVRINKLSYLFFTFYRPYIYNLIDINP